MYKFTISSVDSSLAVIDVAEDLVTAVTTGPCAAQVNDYLNSEQSIWVGDVDNGEKLVVAAPSSDPALMQRAMLQLPAMLKAQYGKLTINGDWSVFTN